MTENERRPQSAGRSRVVLAVILLGAASLAGLARWKSVFISNETVREGQREEIRLKVEREQQRAMESCDWEQALREEAGRLVSEKPHASKEATQRARPVPLIPVES